jgi:hypothetical protein
MVEFDDRFVRPKPAANLRPHHDLAGLFQQQKQNPQRLLAEKKPDAVFA